MAAVVIAALVAAAPGGSSSGAGAGLSAPSGSLAKSEDYAGDVAVQADGKIVAVGGRFLDAGGDFALARYTRGGRLDATFGRLGKEVADFGPRGAVASAAVVQSDGKLVVAGGASRKNLNFNCGAMFALARVGPSGQLDRGFGSDGKVTTNLGCRGVETIALQADGSILAAGERYGAVTLVRYRPDGQLDRNFGNGGIVQTRTGGESYVDAIAVQPDGRIAVAGSSVMDLGSGPTYVTLLRYTADGRLDASFGSAGMVLTDLGVGSEGASAIALQRDGKILVAAWGRGDFTLGRFTTEGQLDTTFGDHGKVVTDLGSDDDVASTILLRGDGTIIAAGSRDTRFALACYSSEGRLEPSFGTGGEVVTDFRGQNDARFITALQADGQLVALVTSRRGDFALRRFTAEGRTDVTFGNGGSVSTDFGGPITRMKSFSATRTKHGILVRWRTASEAKTRGFRVYRGTTNGRMTRVNTRLIRAKGSTSHGGSYSFHDRGAPKATRGYSLTEVKRDGKTVGRASVRIQR